MNRKSLLTFTLILCIISPALAGTDTFRVATDGSIAVRGLIFSDFNNYVQSDFFREQGMRCGTKTPPANAKDQTIAKSVADCTTALTTIQAEYWPSSQTYIMPVWFHVIYRSDGTGNISEATINEQIQVLNEDYGAMSGTMGAQGYNTRMQFQLVGITRTQNDSWFDNDDETTYKSSLNKDPSRYVNIYSTTAGGYLGYAYLPQWAAGTWYDGIVLNYKAVGGRNNGFFTYDQGRTLVHEMGHYLGLYHTFEGYDTCVNSYSGGDLIVDTSAEEKEHYDCTQTYTCGTPDPIHNYMNYTDDTCMYQFSREQANRAICSTVNYRPATYRVVADTGEVNFGITPILLPLLLSH